MNSKTAQESRRDGKRSRLEDHPVFSEHWLDDYEEALEEVGRAILKLDKLYGLPPSIQLDSESSRRR
jgi:hypothetical protein